MACACQKISGMKKGKKKARMSGYTDDIMASVLDGGLLVGGAYAAQELKAMLPAPTDPTSFYGKNQSYIVNGAGIVLGLLGPSMIPDAELKKYLKPVGAGVAVQCGLSLIKSIRSGVPSVNAWNTYALGRNKIGVQNTYALGANARNFSVPTMGRAFDVNGNPMPTRQPVRQPIVKVAKRAVGGM